MDKVTPEGAPVHGTCMTPQERVDLVIAFARVLYVNGQATEQTVDAAERLGRALGLRAKMMLRWGELRLEDRDTKAVSEIAAEPDGVDINRVASKMREIEEVEVGQLAPIARLSADEEN